MALLRSADVGTTVHKRLLGGFVGGGFLEVVQLVDIDGGRCRD
jgi:hypothetical protein